jgi:SulP family sulfate permease
MPTLAGVLIVAAVGSLRPYEILTILRTGRTAQIAFVTTFVATLFLPVAAAVGIGVALSLLLQLNREALDLVVIELVPRPDGSLEEHPAPARLESKRVVVLDVGSLLYAGARTLLAHLPDPSGTIAPVVVLRLRGRTALGATFFSVVADYAARLAAVGGRLFLSGVGPELLQRMHSVGALDADEKIRAFEATPVLGESSRQAYEEAGTWLIGQRGGQRDEQARNR